MAVVRYCIISSSTGVCSTVISWDNTYTYYPPTGYIIAGDNTGEIGWIYSNGSLSGGTWTDTSAPAGPADGISADLPDIIPPFSDWSGGSATTTFFDLTLDLGGAT